MGRVVCGVFAAVLVLSQASAEAQWFYPGGYGGFGWGGWGLGTGTVQGDIAHGLGAMAAGAGVYNQQTAVANAIDTQTAIHFNEYMFQSQMEANRRYHQRLAQRRQNVNETAATVYDRLRNRPEAADITRGDALNVVYDELTNPRVYLKVAKEAKTTVKGSLIRQIPFQYAAAAITASVDDLTQRGAPEALRKAPFEADRVELHTIAEELRQQNQDDGQYDKASLEKARAKVLEILKKADTVFPKNSRDWNESRRFLKAVYGLLRMLETPAVDVLLAGVENRPEANLGELLTFMQSFNLRFGVANTPEQKAAYTTLYPLLIALRDETVGRSGPSSPPTTAGPEQAGAFFEKMELEDMAKKPSLKPPGAAK